MERRTVTVSFNLKLWMQQELAFCENSLNCSCRETENTLFEFKECSSSLDHSSWTADFFAEKSAIREQEKVRNTVPRIDECNWQLTTKT